MKVKVSRGLNTYGHRVGILMSDSTIPRIPGDPDHAETFPFPVVNKVLKGFPFEDLKVPFIGSALDTVLVAGMENSSDTEKVNTFS